MADVRDLKKTKEVYDKLCKMLDNRDWKYKRDDDELTISFGVSGDDLPMGFVIVCDAERQLIRVMSMLPFKMGEDKRVEGAIATSYANYSIADGSFDYNIFDGTIIFRLTASFRESTVGEDLFKYLVDVSTFTVDKYNDRFEALNSGKISLEEFMAKN